MFTDGPVTPTRLEVLIDFLRETSMVSVSRDVVVKLLQPSAIIGNDGNRTGAAQTILAADQLGLIENSATIRPTFERSDKRKTREIVLDAIDKLVLSDTSVEPYFAPFYSFVLSLNESGSISPSDGDRWETRFTAEVNQGVRGANPFNKTKLTGLRRWYEYSGLGWFDPAGVFQPNPYYRIKRSLAHIFGKTNKVSGNDFIVRLAETCPELDGGRIYSETTKHIQTNVQNVCTLGLSHALVDLHIDGVIRLDCPVDARGWDIGFASPPRDNTLKAHKINTVEYLKTKKQK